MDEKKEYNVNQIAYEIRLGAVPIVDDPVFEQRESLEMHASYETEQKMQSFIENGDPKGLYDFFYSSVADNTLNHRIGSLSKDELRNAKYLAVCAITVAMRAAIRGGLYEIIAYNFSDGFIRHIDEMTNTDEIYNEAVEVSIKMAQMVSDANARKNYNPMLKRAREYVVSHLHFKIALADAAAAANCAPTYLSRLFKKELGVSFSDFVARCKTEEAKRMLASGKHDYSSTANYLAFSSQSHFSSVFRRWTGETPSEYVRSLHLNS